MVIDTEDLDPDTRDEIKYRILAVKYTMDDPVLQAYMLQKLLDVYKKHKLIVPPTIIKYCQEEIKVIEKQLKARMAAHKKEIEKKYKKRE